MTHIAEHDTAYLEEVVPVMRRLGVVEFGGVKLGADPATGEKISKPHKSAEERAWDALFAATRFRPKMPRRDETKNVPRAVADRRKAKKTTDPDGVEARSPSEG